jgi:hypothetical protein
VSTGWHPSIDRSLADLVFFFGTRQSLASGQRYRELSAIFPKAHVVGCGTGGQIHGDDVSDDEITAVALQFGATKVRMISELVTSAAQSRMCGEKIGARLLADDLSGVMVLSDGLNVNGSELVDGITK